MANLEKPIIKIYSYSSGDLRIKPFLKEVCPESLQKSPHTSLDLVPIQLLVQIEEEELEALQRPDSLSYKTLEKTLEEAAAIAKCNIVLQIGHTEICQVKLKSFPFYSFPKNSLPTAVFIIACGSAGGAKLYNKDKELRNMGFYFFGFQNLMHVIRGKIFFCKDGHNEMPNMDCSRPGSEENYLNVTNKGQTIEGSGIDSYGELNPSLQCCVAKYERFRHTFYKNINERGCNEFDTASMVKKLQTIRDESGALRKGDTFLLEHSIVRLGEGVSCTKQTPCSIVPEVKKEFLSNAKKFNEEGKVYSVLREIHIFLSKPYKEENDLRIVQLLQSLRKEERIYVLTYTAKEDSYLAPLTIEPLLFLLFKKKYTFAMKDILKRKEVDFTQVGVDGSSLPLELLDQYLEDQVWKQKSFGTHGVVRYTDKQLFRVFLDLQKVTSPEVFFAPNPSGETPLTLLLQSEFAKNELGLISFFLLSFPSVIPEKSDELLSALLGNPFLDSATKLYYLEILFSYGVRPKTINKITMYEENEPGEIAPDILELLYSYGFDNNISSHYSAPMRLDFYRRMLDKNSEAVYEYRIELRRKIQHLESILSRRTNNNTNADYESESNRKSSQLKVLKKIKIYRERLADIFSFVRSAYDAYYETVSFLEAYPVYRIKESILKKKIEANISPYTEGAKAIGEIKEFFSKVQKELKKLKTLSSEEKEAILTKFRTIYESKQKNENEGNSAMRRYDEMMSAYNTIFRLKNTPNVTANYQWGGKKTRRTKALNRKTRKH